MDLSDSSNFINRELSWMEFNTRILGEATDKGNPLFERLKFLSITASNLDEFVMIRVASLKTMVNEGFKKKDMAGMTPKQQLEALGVKEHEFVDRQYKTYSGLLVPQLRKAGVELKDRLDDLDENQESFIDHYFINEVYPVLTPMAVDSSRPFPLVRNKTLNLASLMRKKSGEKTLEFATVQVPSVLPRLVEIPPSTGGGRAFVFLEDVIARNIQKLYLNYDVIATSPYRIMRNADFDIDEEDVSDLLIEIERQVKKRQRGEAIKLEVATSIDRRLLSFLKDNLKIKDDDTYYVNGPLDLTFLMKVYDLEGFDALKHAKYTPLKLPQLMGDVDLFERIRANDILLHHPYDSFEPVLDFVAQAANDPSVLAIKQTLYRVSGNSPIIKSLAKAAESGKQVTVLVELKARFDEEHNIIWAKMLEKAGCHVIYGLVGLKTHCKITLVVRREEDGIKRYVHLGTGNYNDSTAKLYTDMGLLTCSNRIGEDATAVFNMISGYSEPPFWNKLTLAPLWLRKRLVRLIDRETANAANGGRARIIAKMNSLCDMEIIEKLYEASNAGVKIDLIVRGICCLKPGVRGLSENISVRSIVGNFLEHARIFYFDNDGNDEVYMASADWMPRNLDKRVEIMFPVEDEELKAQVMHVLDVQLEDNEKAHVMMSDGTYVKKRRGRKTIVVAQEQFCQETIQRNAATRKRKTRTFVPRTQKN